MTHDRRPLTPKPRRVSRANPEQRRRAILDAALEVFAESGFASARMQDVAARAGVAKGTLYLYFKDKAALFEGLIHEAIDPVLGSMEARLADFDGTTRDFLHLLFAHLSREAVHSPRRHIVRLMIGEGERFPDLAAFYHREVIARGVNLVRAINERALARGEITSDAGKRYPQLIFAPLLIAALWEGVFQRLDPLDSEDMLKTHVDVVLRGLGWDESRGGVA